MTTKTVKADPSVVGGGELDSSVLAAYHRRVSYFFHHNSTFSGKPKADAGTVVSLWYPGNSQTRSVGATVRARAVGK